MVQLSVSHCPTTPSTLVHVIFTVCCSFPVLHSFDPPVPVVVVVVVSAVVSPPPVVVVVSSDCTSADFSSPVVVVSGVGEAVSEVADVGLAVVLVALSEPVPESEPDWESSRPQS